MKHLINLAMTGLLTTLGLVRAAAGSTSTTNYWVENVNFSLTAYAQVGQNVLIGSLPTKQFLFFLSGLTNTGIITGTNGQGVTLYATNANFAKQSGAKLLYKIPIVTTITTASTNITATSTNITRASTNFSFLTPTFVVRYGSGKTQVDTSVDAFITDASYNTVSQSYGSLVLGKYTFSELNFNTQTGTSFNFVGFDTQTCGSVTTKAKLTVTGVVKQRKIVASNYSGQLTGKIQDTTFNAATTTVTGTITIDSGTLE